MNHGNLPDVENPLLTATVPHWRPSRFRQVFPQVLASVITTFMFLDYGVSVSYPTVVISALTGHNNASNPHETIHMTADQSSWLGSITYLGKLFGSLVCGFASEQFGRRNSMLLINIPLFITFGLYYYSDSVLEVFIASVLLGFTTGFMKAPTSTYISELCEVTVRGTLSSLTTVALTGAPLIIYILGNITQWRNIALYCFVLQIAITIALYFVPESPLWLLSKKHDKAALKSLRWFRGWVPESLVREEYDSIKKFANSCAECRITEVKCIHTNGEADAQPFKELKRKKTLKPLFILAIMGFAAYFAGTHHLVVYMVQILDTYRSPISPNWATIVVAVVGFVAAFATMALMRLLGKRKIFLLSILGMTLSTLTLSIYGFKYLPPNTKSFDQAKYPMQPLNESDISSIPLIAFSSMHFFTSVAVTIPYAMLSELFSMKSRSMATAVSTTVHNILAFVSTKSFYNIENWLDLPTTLGVYCGFGIISLIVLFLILPETERRTLEDIEVHFSDNKRKLTDRYIVKRPSNIALTNNIVN